MKSETTAATMESVVTSLNATRAHRFPATMFSFGRISHSTDSRARVFLYVDWNYEKANVRYGTFVEFYTEDGGEIRET